LSSRRTPDHAAHESVVSRPLTNEFTKELRRDVGRGSTGTRRGWTALVVTVTVLGLSAAVQTAQAATVHLGSPLTASFTPVGFSSQQVVTLAQLDLPEKGANIASPVDGTVVSYQVAPSNGTFSLQVLRRLREISIASVRSSPPTAVNTTGISAPIATDLGIRRGDLIGIRDSAVGDTLGGSLNGSTYAAWGPPLEDGAVSREPNFAAKGYEIGLDATVRYCRVPKLKGLSLKAARADLARADCKVGKVTKARKTRTRKVVVSQSERPGKAISDTAPIDLKVSRRQRG
jgi:hypothetical protein